MIAVVTEVRIYRIDGNYYADSSFAKILERYHNSFGDLCLITRVVSGGKRKNGYVGIDDKCSIIYDTHSILKLLLSGMGIEIKKILDRVDFAILRVPSIASIKVCKYIIRRKKKYMVEVMGCIWDSYWNHGLIGKIMAPYVFLKTKMVVHKANYAVYVTQKFLQNRYPCNGKTIGVSNVNIASVDEPRTYEGFNNKSFTMMTAGAINVKYKGQEYVIKAIRQLKESYGISIKYYLAGKGDSNRLERIAKKNNVFENVVFLGMLSKEELARQMRNTDIYVQPSLQEGLPRSLIEAMSHGCVCLGSTTGGIPELLNKKQLFKRKNKGAIVDAITETIESDLATISNENIEKSKGFLSKKLDAERSNFYREIMQGMKNDGEY